MSHNEDGWFYGENDQWSRSQIDIGRIMRGQGFDEEDDPFRSREKQSIKAQTVSNETCTCNPERMFSDAQLLKTALSERPWIFPKTIQQLDSFTHFGGYAGGRWGKWVQVDSSRLQEEDQYGFIRLGANCNISGHSLKIVQVTNEIFRIDGMTPEMILPDTEPSDLNEELVVNDDQDEDELEAKMYDERTYGDLEANTDMQDQEIALNSPELWRKSAYSDEKILKYLAYRLNVHDIAYMSRFMPPDQVEEWMNIFGEDSLEALQMLNVALGGTRQAAPYKHDPFDMAVTALTKDIRKYTKRRFNEFKLQLQAENEINKTKKKK